MYSHVLALSNIRLNGVDNTIAELCLPIVHTGAQSVSMKTETGGICESTYNLNENKILTRSIAYTLGSHIVVPLFQFCG